MPASVTSPADMLNLTLRRIGYKGRVGNLYDGSAAAKAALDLYAQTRDQLLRQSNWGFAEKIAAATLSGQAAPQPWSVEYSYPADCLRLRNMFNADYLADKNNPRPVLYTIASDAVAGKVILCNVAAATLVYTAQITNPARWESLFVEALATALGERLAPALAGKETGEMAAAAAKAILPLAEGVEG